MSQPVTFCLTIWLRNAVSIASSESGLKGGGVDERSMERIFSSGVAYQVWLAVRMVCQKWIRSLSLLSSEIQATLDAGRCSVHQWFTRVDFPKPAGARSNVSLSAGSLSSRLSNGVRLIN